MIHHATRERFRGIIPTLLEWHRTNQRSFIWRDLRRSPYVVLVSEFMLQQTGVKQVEKHLPEFIRKFPTVKKLAAASRPEIIRAWHGLGYNRRAINLHLAAKAIAANGRFPKGLKELQELPGVGLYTASAVLAFAHNADVPVVDVNIERVLSRLWKPMPNFAATLPMRDIYELDVSILPKGSSGVWHEALMDLGSTICTKNAPKCSMCPLGPVCPSTTRMKRAFQERKAPQERRYFGQPRRIWRGRILKATAEAEQITYKKLIAILRRKFKIDDSEFVPFVQSVLTMLGKEGFITQTKKGVIHLANHQ
ncbi:MAG TPA: A/G-specific adenine glycosylase [Candidatus Kapabacteria bacterium]|nr:A/G-specific adenine glycosylase [Candidatus Kapabacteria bacterium]